MLKKFSKFLLLVLIIFVVSSSSFVCLADESNEITDTVNTTETNDEDTITDEDLLPEFEEHLGDLYVFDTNIVMDKYVDGNAFLFGDNIEITGRVNGNLFVFGNNVKFNKSIVRYSTFVCANSVYYDGGCGIVYYDYVNLYVAAQKFEATYDSYVTGDIKAVATDAILKATIYGDVDLICDTANFGEGEDCPLVYGNLRYTANKEVNIPEDVMQGEGSVTYTKASEANSTSVTDVLLNFANCVVVALALYIILNKVTPNFVEKVSNQKFSAIGLLKAFGIGIATIFIVLIFFVLLLGTGVAIKLAFILALLFAILCLVSVPVLAISIANILKTSLKIEKTYMFYLVLSLVSIILNGITYIPFIGGLIGFVINVTSIGLIINMYIPHKDLTDEEKDVITEAKQQAEEDK